jgi:hypothetical protein
VEIYAKRKPGIASSFSHKEKYISSAGISIAGIVPH